MPGIKVLKLKIKHMERSFTGRRQTDLLVLVRCDSDELGFREGLTADHLLDASDFHNVDPRLVLVQRIEHDLQKHQEGTLLDF